MSLEEDAAGQKMQLAYRLQQVAALVENKVTDLWPLNDLWTLTFKLKHSCVFWLSSWPWVGPGRWVWPMNCLWSKKKTQKNRKKKESRRRVKASSWTKTKTPTKLLFSSCRDTWHPPQLQDLQRGESKRETRAYTGNKMDKNGQVTGNVLEGRLQSHRDALCYYFYKCVVLVHLKCVVFIIRRVCMCKLSLANSSIN